MRVAEVIGRLTLSKAHPSLRGATWLVAVPLTLDGIRDTKTGPTLFGSGRGEPFAVYDELGAGTGSLIAVSEGAEASAPFHPAQKPIDAYNAAILDTLELE